MKSKVKRLSVVLSLTTLFSCAQDSAKQQAQVFLNEYTAKFQKLAYAADKADWLANTAIGEEHDSLSVVAAKSFAR